MSESSFLSSTLINRFHLRLKLTVNGYTQRQCKVGKMVRFGSSSESQKPETAIRKGAYPQTEKYHPISSLRHKSRQTRKSAIYSVTVISTRSFTNVMSIFLDNSSDRTFHCRLVLGDAPIRTYRLQDTEQANVS